MATNPELDNLAGLVDLINIEALNEPFGRTRCKHLTFRDLPSDRCIASFSQNDDGSLKRHWCWMAEIKAVENFGCFRTIARDGGEHEEIVVEFHLDSHENSDNMKLSKLVPGHTIAVMYPVKYPAGKEDYDSHVVTVNRTEEFRELKAETEFYALMKFDRSNFKEPFRFAK
ncbi:hypothetical protein B0T19DRAFT_405372 [Cercophora scortea]|uniref:Uncharacterized protein n=1 Tax=Cercophora scortea TaxID=314031 RepID=A0AAE0I337_9PEZI|nr:hypothetical protein B0T19DRAFT_405372 [Cercophora scortea]